MTEWSPDIHKLQTRDDQEWLAVEREYAGRLYHYIEKRVPDRQAREDVLQETFLGAVRGIGGFDPIYTFEQYLFGICHNRTIDHLRRRKLETLQAREEDEGGAPIERLALEDETPSRVARRRDLSRQAQTLMAQVLRDWIQESWGEGEFERLMVVEALFAAGWRNKDAWRHFKLRDETAVAGIKFRAVNRLRELAHQRQEAHELLLMLEQSAQQSEGALDFDVGEVWRESRASCPARYWLARQLAQTLPSGPARFVAFHLTDMGCAFCQANLDDLRRAEVEGGLEALHEKLAASTLHFLRSNAGN